MLSLGRSWCKHQLDASFHMEEALTPRTYSYSNDYLNWQRTTHRLLVHPVLPKMSLTARALIDVYGEELTLRVDDEAITFKVGQTSRYSYNDVVSINRIDVIDVACEEYAQEVLGFSDSSTSDFILEEIKACLTNDSIPPGIDDDDFDPEGDLLLLEKLLNDDPSSPLPPK
ncbi:hypothetical protein Tco_0748291 [Tanacetum coccineum]|uniref:Reverse transcriptase domain-containing protein n=1 Tax=Tanacetum coccineum TaxID=301880 RepID=A0ABQ4YVE0_9ASTR